jgi:hypothetical protein
MDHGNGDIFRVAPRTVIGRSAYDRSGERIGRIDDLYLDDHTGDPEWIAVTNGWFGTRVSFVPVAGAVAWRGHVQVPYLRDEVRRAPAFDPEGHLDPDQEDRLAAHYGIERPRIVIDLRDHPGDVGAVAPPAARAGDAGRTA